VLVQKVPSFSLFELKMGFVELLFTRTILPEILGIGEGDVFDTDKIRESLGAYRQLHGVQGYIDFSVEPDFDPDDLTRRISLTLMMDQQKQFRIDKVEVSGLDPRTESLLRSMMKPGDVFNNDLVKQFFEENKSELPSNASPEENVKFRKNVRDGIAPLSFDFLTCPILRIGSSVDERDFRE